ncbi:MULTISPECIES: heavy metal sensor histidine kinase [unclassified Burkholderia]|uniref:heavy metal sensor histidine kinase n=1 Tax=unclassified Burkholderia TaxID=2613784 RepID=UPI0010F88930|nr:MULTISPECIES: heavy metal sensor histidine kinase [unclassified Burkholderia]
MIFRVLFRTLRARLTLFIVLSTSAVLAVSGIALYGALGSRIDSTYAHEMSVTLSALRAHLNEIESVDDIPAHAGIWLDQLHGHQNMDLAIYDPAGSPLFVTSRFAAYSPLLHTRATDNPESVTPPGSAIQYLRARAPVGGAPASTVQIVIQRDGTTDQALLRDYAYTIVLIEILGVAVAAVLAYGSAMLGLSPLRRLVARAEQMSTSRLAHPLPELDTAGELKELEHAFNGMLMRLNESFIQLSQFSSNLAHDMRTPLTNLLTQAQVALSRRRSADEYRDVIESSIDDYRRLSRMIDDMLYLARAENARSKLSMRTLDAVEEATRVAGYYEPMAEEGGVEIRVDGAASVWADTLMYQRALSNLLSNALAHAPRGTVIDVECRHTANSTTISVSDRGPGIAPPHLDRIFDRFYRADPARHDSASGTGLGLAIVRSIMHNHGGECGVVSEPHVRTTFWLRFPAHAN